MTTSDPDRDDQHQQQINNLVHLAGMNGNAADSVELDALAAMATEAMDAAPPAWKTVRGSYAADINEVVLKNMPEKMVKGDFVVPNQDQLHRLPETIAKGDTPKTPMANRDVAMAKMMNIMRNQSMHSMPFAFMQEMRAIVPETAEEWNPPIASSSAAMQPIMERMIDDLKMDNHMGSIETHMRSLEYFGDLGSPQIPGMPAGYDMKDLHMPSYSFMDLSSMNPFADFANLGKSVPTNDYTKPLHGALPGGAGVPPASTFDLNQIRRDFPILQEKVNGRNLIWLDNAATTQKPTAVIDRLKYFYEHENSNIHRAAHELAARATDAYEHARETVRRFLNASSVSEIIFVRGATEAINLVAQSWGRQNLKKDDEIVITWLEHHANIVPWQMLAAETGAILRVAPVDDRGEVIPSEYERLLGPRTKLVSFTHVSNALGTVTPVEEMVAAAHRWGARVLVDGAQSVSHMATDVQLYDCDFYVFSGHKIFAPTGIGVLYGKSEVLDGMQPWQGGGNMIKDVTFERTLYQAAPVRFEAGTGSIGDAVGLGAALEYIERIGMVNIHKHESDLMGYATELMARIPGLKPIGTARNKAGVLSFVLDGYTTEQVSKALNAEGIAVRAGHHCAQPILRRYGLESTVRPSLALYNTRDDIDAFVAALWNLKSGRNPGMF